MKLKVSDDAEAPVDMSFAALTDYAGIEDELRGYGLQITRIGCWKDLALGVAWGGAGEIRGRMRTFEAKVTALEPGRMVEVTAHVGDVRAVHETRVIPLGAKVTRINLTLDLRAESLKARILLQSLKLARGRILERMQKRLTSDIRRIEREAG